MTAKKVLVLFAFTATLVMVDWILQVFAERGSAMRWVYLLVNLPFGLIYISTEAQFASGQYVLFGRPVEESMIAIVQMAAVYTQALVYFAAWLRFEKTQSYTSDTMPLPRGLNRLFQQPVLVIGGLTLLTLVLSSVGMELLIRLPALNGQPQIPVTGGLRVALDFGRLMACLWLLAGLASLLLFPRRWAPVARR